MSALQTAFTLFNANALELLSLRKEIQSASGFVRGRVLDIGCGEKPYEPLFRGRYSAYIGIDLETVNRSRADVFGDSLHLPFKSSTFDTVFSTQVLEHVRDPFAMLREIGAVLAPDGVLILTAPQAWPLHEEPFDFFRYTRYGLEELLRTAGLRTVRITERMGGAATLGELFCVMLWSKHTSGLMRRLLKPIFFIVQVIAAVADRLYRYPELTLGYLVVARKPA